MGRVCVLDPVVLGAACGLVWYSRGFSIRWNEILDPLTWGDLGILDGMRISILGAFVSNVTPLTQAVSLCKAYLLTEKGLTAGQSTAVIATKTICNALARVTLGLAASVWLLLCRFLIMPEPCTSSWHWCHPLFFGVCPIPLSGLSSGKNQGDRRSGCTEQVYAAVLARKTRPNP